MFSPPARVKILILGFFTNVVYQTKSEIYVDGSRTLKRHSGHGVAFANFAAHKFSYLNITPLVSFSVTEFRECGKHCVDHSSCFSFNAATFRDMEGKTLCELLPSDKYNKSSSFVASQTYHHFTIMTPCFSGPCMNNATCVAKYQDNDYHCTCVPGYIGRNCKTDIDDCFSEPCLNGGSCTDQANAYTCNCLTGYTGVHCETDINECSSSPCVNGGTCVDLVNKFQCNCIAYIIGIRCETIDVPDPVALYPLNSVYTTSDMMGNQPTGIASNVQLAPGPYGDPNGSYQFFGLSNSYVELPNNGALDTQYSITICMWVYPEGQDGPLFQYRPSGADWGVHFWVVSGLLYFRPEKSSSAFTSPLQAPFSNTWQWNYVAASYDYSTGVARVWVDGTEVKQLNVGVSPLSTNYNVRMGVKDDDSRRFKGRIARVQVYNIALNLGQVTAVKSRGQS